MPDSIEELESRMWKRKMIAAWALTIPIMIIMYAGMLFGVHIVPMNMMPIVLLVLGFPIIFIVGWNTVKMGFRGLFTFYFNMDSLIALGTVIAYLTGFFAYFELSQDYSGVSSMIMTIFITGKFVEAKARGRASKEIMKLLELGAKKARVLRGKEEVEIAITELTVGDIMIIKPGEKIPTDGIVTKGNSAVDEAMVTGESIPVDKTKGSSVIGATINQDGILYVKATKVGEDTFLAHIIELVEEAQGTKVPIQKVADKITSVFVPIILVLSAITFLAWILITGDLSRSVGVAIAVLVIACPCSLGLATPIALMVGSGMGAKKGILIRKGEAIQTMKEIKTIVFDKTGTLTHGKPVVTDVFAVTKKQEKAMVEIAASIENLSEHPVGKAIVNYAKLKTPKKVTKFSIIRGKGVIGTIGKLSYTIGNERLMQDKNINTKSVKETVTQFENEGKTTMIIAEGKKAIGAIAVADSPKEEAKKVIAYLQKQGYKTVILTGDNERTAKAIAKSVGIDEVIANVLPEDKSKKVMELQQKGMVAFVGDGVNDAPALKQANVGIAMGTGTDIAIEAGDIVSANGSLISIPQAINLSKGTFRKIKQNLFWAFAYNVVAIPLAIAGVLHPIIAEIAMAASSITVVTNANLLRKTKL